MWLRARGQWLPLTSRDLLRLFLTVPSFGVIVFWEFESAEPRLSGDMSGPESVRSIQHLPVTRVSSRAPWFLACEVLPSCKNLILNPDTRREMRNWLRRYIYKLSKCKENTGADCTTQLGSFKGIVSTKPYTRCYRSGG